MPSKGGDEPDPPILMLPLGPAVFAVGVGDQPQAGQDAAQPGWVQPPGRLHQHRLGLGRHRPGQVVGAGGHHLSVRGRELAAGEGLGGGRQGTAEHHPAVRTELPAAAAAPIRSRPRSPPQDQDPFGPDPIGEPAQVLGSQRFHVGGQGGQPIRGLYRMCVRVHGGNLIKPPLEGKHHPESVDKLTPTSGPAREPVSAG
jgi:hypothetical protein